MRIALLALVSLAVAGPACAGVIAATPLTLPAILLFAKAGDEVTLAAGDYDGVRLSSKTYVRPLTIDARKATLSGWYWTNVEGVVLRGGKGRGVLPLRIDNGRRIRIVDHPTFIGQEDTTIPGSGYGVRLVGGGDIEVVGASFTGFRAGMTAARVNGLKIADSQFSRMSADGLNLSNVSNVQITGNTFGGTEITPGAHPDAIQFDKPKDLADEGQWSSNVLISKNDIRGPQQGVFGGYIIGATITDNTIQVAFPNAIALLRVRGLVMNNNRIATEAGAAFQARIMLKEVTELTRRGNSVAAAAGKSGMVEKP